MINLDLLLNIWKNCISINMRDPTLKIRYAIGLGDFIAAVLHSRLLGWLTKLITGKSEPCSVCSQRRIKLNKKFPIPFWRLFFKNKDERTKGLIADLEKNDFNYIIHHDGSVQASKVIAQDTDLHKLNLAYNDKFNIFEQEQISQEQRQEARKELPTLPEELSNSPYAKDIYRYILISSQESEINNEYIVRTQVFKIT